MDEDSTTPGAAPADDKDKTAEETGGATEDTPTPSWGAPSAGTEEEAKEPEKKEPEKEEEEAEGTDVEKKAGAGDEQ